MIKVIGGTLFQWDTGRAVSLLDVEADYVHFANKGDVKALVVKTTTEDGGVTAAIPSVLLQSGKPIMVYVILAINGTEKTVESQCLYVIGREKPDDYVYEEQEYYPLKAILDSVVESEEYQERIAERAVLKIGTDADLTEKGKPADAEAVGKRLQDMRETVDGKTAINDNEDSANTTWSGEKINEEIMSVSQQCAFRHIATVKNDTDAGVKQFEITKDSKGRPFACSAFSIYIRTPAAASGSQLFIGNAMYQWMYLSGIARAQDAERSAVYEVFHTGNGWWRGKMFFKDNVASEHTGHSSYAYQNLKSNYQIGEKAESLVLFAGKDGMFPPGTVIEISGR